MIRGGEPIPTGRSREEISDIMAAMWTGEDSVNIASLPNAGQVRDLPPGDVVETYGALNGTGASGIVFGELPPPVAALVHPHVFNQEAIVQAGLTGDMDLAFHAFLNDPLVGSGPDARKMFEEIFEAQRVSATVLAVLAFQHTPAFGCRLSAGDLVEDCGVAYLGVFC